MKKIVYSIGHSNLSVEEFLKVLSKYKIKMLLDVRSVPISSYVPHFNREELEKSLKNSGILYTYCGEIGGRQGMEFREYTKTSKYNESIKKVERLITRGTSAIMCSEKDFTQCHRRFICDTLINDGFMVIQIDPSADSTSQISLIGDSK
jgi:uncharacterized protein (DUF488 family)